jgi:O-methyltransferase
MPDGVLTAPRDSLTDLASTSKDLYLDLLKNCLTRSIFEERGERYRPRRGGWRAVVYESFARLFAATGLELVRRVSFDSEARAEGKDWPAEAETMVGLRRLDNLEHCIHEAVRSRVPGDLIETGVWRGGAAIFMRGVLKAIGDTERVVWAADSFDGLPRPNAGDYPHDERDTHWTRSSLVVPLAEVRDNFARYGLLDEQVRFLPGWFSETLSRARIRRLAVLRLDGDMYESTIVALRSLYPKLSIGGYVIVDDYALANCKAAVDEFRAECGITEPIEHVDWTCIFWRRAR